MSTGSPVWWRRRPGIRGPTRHFVADAIEWRAFEYAVVGSPRKPSLMFACDVAWRCVRTFPSDWATRDDAGLIELSNRR